MPSATIKPTMITADAAAQERGGCWRQQAPKRPAEAVAQRQRQVGEQRSTTRPSTESRRANPDRNDDQMQPQGDSSAEVDRSANALEAAVAALVPLDADCGRQDQEIDPEERQSGARDASCARSSLI